MRIVPENSVVSKPRFYISLGRRNNRDTRNRNTGVFDQVIILNMRYTLITPSVVRRGYSKHSRID